MNDSDGEEYLGSDAWAWMVTVGLIALIGVALIAAVIAGRGH